jgi:hypothetical protein
MTSSLLLLPVHILATQNGSLRTLKKRINELEQTSVREPIQGPIIGFVQRFVLLLGNKFIDDNIIDHPTFQTSISDQPLGDLMSISGPHKSGL